MWYPKFYKNWLIRGIGKWLLQKFTVTVKNGPLKGKKWLLNTRREFRRGTYEPKQSRLFQEMVTQGDVVYDLGAHIGYYTVIASELVGDSGHVVSFEPIPFNLQDLRKHLQINNCNNVTVIEAAVGERSKSARFTKGTGTRTPHRAEAGELTVEMVTLDEIVEERNLPIPDHIKIDVDSTEFLVLQGAESLINQTHPTLFLSVHSNEARTQCLDFLTARGYDLRSMNDKSLTETLDILATYDT